MKNRFFAIFLVLLFTAVSHSAVNYPYPQRKLYGNGTINVVNSTIDNDLKTRFEQYITQFYVKGECNGTGSSVWGAQSGECARIKFTDPDKPDDANYTVSEGIGYAMLMTVYFSSTAKSYQPEFDNLWKYYKRWTNSNGVMDWKINGFSSVSQTGAATDAEFDAALALAMAYYQFGDQKYLDDAKKLVGIIWTKEMESDGLHKPGDAWGSNNTTKNPSYIAPAAFEIFKDLCPSGQCTSSNWSDAISKNYTLLKANQNSTTGLPSGWSNQNGNPIQGNGTATNYDMDATRAPWRWAMAKAWFGHSDAETLLSKLATWVNGLEPGSVKGPIELGGNMGSDANAGYIGSLMCALTHKSTYQGKLNSFWNTMSTLLGASYFNESLYILTGLFVSGNMPNLKACDSNNSSEKAKGCNADMAVIGGNDGDGTRLDRLGEEEWTSYAATWEPWYAYIDSAAGGYNDDGSKKNGRANSSITNTVENTYNVNKNCASEPSWVVVKEDPTDGWVVKIDSYTLDQGTYSYDPFVSLGLDARYNQEYYDLSKCEDGFSYEYKGSAHRFKVLTSVITEGSGEDHAKIIREASNSAWTKVTVPLSELTQPTWVTNANKKAFDPKKIYSFAWELVGDVKAANGTVTAGISSMTGSLALKDFRCLGSMSLPTNARETCNENGEKEIHDVGQIDPVPIKAKPALGNNKMFFAGSSLNLNLAGNTVLQVFDIKGNKVLTMNLASGPSTVSLANLPKGVYFAVAKSASWKQTIKVAVK